MEAVEPATKLRSTARSSKRSGDAPNAGKERWSSSRRRAPASITIWRRRSRFAPTFAKSPPSPRLGFRPQTPRTRRRGSNLVAAAQVAHLIVCEGRSVTAPAALPLLPKMEQRRREPGMLIKVALARVTPADGARSIVDFAAAVRRPRCGPGSPPRVLVRQRLGAGSPQRHHPLPSPSPLRAHVQAPTRCARRQTGPTHQPRALAPRRATYWQ